MEYWVFDLEDGYIQVITDTLAHAVGILIDHFGLAAETEIWYTAHLLYHIRFPWWNLGSHIILDDSVLVKVED